MDILITGARSPAAMEWSRICLKSGHRVWLADSLDKPIARHVTGLSGYLRLPPANQNPRKYIETLNQIVVQHGIEKIIPTCEEIFFLPKARIESGSQVDWFMPETQLLYDLHHKYKSLQIIRDIGVVRVPDTRLCKSKDQLEPDNKTILKPVHSRFGQNVVRNVHHQALHKIDISEQKPWVQQEKIIGTTLCDYAIFDKGRLIAHQAYVPMYCLNNSAATYFKPYQDDNMFEFVREFGKRTGFHGQVAFDYIQREEHLYVIECNPRATSGIHMLANHLWLGERGELRAKASDQQPMRIGWLLPLLFGPAALFKGDFRRLIVDFRQARDVFVHDIYPLKPLAQLQSFWELYALSRKLNLSITEASTHDIEWN